MITIKNKFLSDLERVFYNADGLQAYNRITRSLEPVKPTRQQNFSLRLKGYARLGEREYKDEGKYTVYLYKCKVGRKELLLIDRLRRSIADDLDSLYCRL